MTQSPFSSREGKYALAAPVENGSDWWYINDLEKMYAIASVQASAFLDPQKIVALAWEQLTTGSLRGVREDSPPKGFLEVGNFGGEVIVNHPDLQPDANGVGHIVFSPEEARGFAWLLLKNAAEAEG
jgi:hypothetical protein